MITALDRLSMGRFRIEVTGSFMELSANETLTGKPGAMSHQRETTFKRKHFNRRKRTFLQSTSGRGGMKKTWMERWNW